jgi:hypothetical protein
MTRIRLRVQKQITIKGEPKTCQPGDWVDIANQQTIRLWIANGWADMPHKPRAGMLPRSCGVIGWGKRPVNATLTRLEKDYHLQVNLGQPDQVVGDIPYLYTLYWNGEVILQDNLLVPGFGLLYTWWGCYPLMDYDTLATDIGTPEARERTVAVIHDLRVPVPNPVLLFVRRNTYTQKLINTWAEERETGDDWRLCFLRALHRVPGLWWPLPYTWGTSDGVDKYER